MEEITNANQAPVKLQEQALAALNCGMEIYTTDHCLFSKDLVFSPLHYTKDAMELFLMASRLPTISELYLAGNSDFIELKVMYFIGHEIHTISEIKLGKNPEQDLRNCIVKGIAKLSQDK